MACTESTERRRKSREARFEHETAVRRKLVVEPSAAHMNGFGARQGDVERGELRERDRRERLAIELVVPEEMQSVAHNRAAKSAAELLILPRHDLLQDGIFSI